MIARRVITKERRVDINPSVMCERWAGFAPILRDFRREVYEDGVTTKVCKFDDGFTIVATGDEVGVGTVMLAMVGCELMFRQYEKRIEDFVNAFVRGERPKRRTVDHDARVSEVLDEATAQLLREALS